MCSRFLGQWHSAHIWSCGPYPVQWFHDSTNNGEGMCQRINLLKDFCSSQVCKMCVWYNFVFYNSFIHFKSICKIFSKYFQFLFCFILIIMIINMIDLCIFTIVSFIVAFCDVHESSQNLHHLSHHLHPCGVRLFCFRVHILRHEHICKYMCTKNFFKRHVLEV